MKVQRQLPRWKNIKPLLGWSLPKFFNGDKALARCITIDDLRKLSIRRVPKAVFDYVDGGANEETSLIRSRDAFSRIEFRPRVLRDVKEVDLGTTILGKRVDLPIIFAPTGYTRMMHYTGEPGVAAVAAAHNMIYSLSTMGTTSAEELTATVPEVRRWFQLYIWRDREQSKIFIQKAKDAGFEALVLTVDTPVAGQRNRDIRNGLTVPPKITTKTFFNMATKVRWWLNMLTTPPLEFATFRNFNRPLSEIAALVFDPGITIDDVVWLKSIWDGAIIIKGIQSVEDAKALAKIGVDAIVLSNHGGRQLDCGVVPLEILPVVVAAVGKKMEVYIDGGVMSGKDVLAAIGLGAKAVLVGRAYLYGAMAAGPAGVEKMISILRQEMKTTMQLTGVTSIDAFTSEYVRLRDH